MGKYDYSSSTPPATYDSLMVCNQGKHREVFKSMAVLPESVVEQYGTLLP